VDLVLSVQPGRLSAAATSWLATFGVKAPKSPREAEQRSRESLQFALRRGSQRRVAWQFAKSYAGAAALRRKSGASK
jgi:predicted AAA+ superfamily ATPase